MNKHGSISSIDIVTVKASIDSSYLEAANKATNLRRKPIEWTTAGIDNGCQDSFVDEKQQFETTGKTKSTVKFLLSRVDVVSSF